MSKEALEFELTEIHEPISPFYISSKIVNMIAKAIDYYGKGSHIRLILFMNEKGWEFYDLLEDMSPK